MDERERLVNGMVESRANETGTRLVLVSALNDFLHKAYDALLHHGVNYKKLRAYNEGDNALFDQTPRPKWEAFQRFTHWLSLMHNDLNAAVRRKTSIREV